MTAHVLNFNPQTGTPRLETFVNKEQMTAFYRGYPQGVPIVKKADLDAQIAAYAGNQWVLDLLAKINRKELED